MNFIYTVLSDLADYLLQPPKSVLQICVWQLLLKSFKNVCE